MFVWLEKKRGRVLEGGVVDCKIRDLPKLTLTEGRRERRSWCPKIKRERAQGQSKPTAPRSSARQGRRSRKVGINGLEDYSLSGSPDVPALLHGLDTSRFRSELTITRSRGGGTAP